ncbi:MAG: hypothetical protein MJY65_04885 [Bacteroidaceae bacterium]|nr:hypothetical protein [Bacteroidaceae bacterium]
MDLCLTYAEMQRACKSAGTELSFSYEAADTVRVGYPFRMMGMSNEIGLNLRVLGVVGNDVRMMIDGAGGMVNMALGMASGIVREKLGGVVEFGDDSQVVLHLDRINKLEPVLNKLQLTGISFNQTAAVVSLEMK